MDDQRTNRESRRDVDFLSCVRNEESGINIIETLKARLEAKRPRSPDQRSSALAYGRRHLATQDAAKIQCPPVRDFRRANFDRLVASELRLAVRPVYVAGPTAPNRRPTDVSHSARAKRPCPAPHLGPALSALLSIYRQSPLRLQRCGSHHSARLNCSSSGFQFCDSSGVV